MWAGSGFYAKGESGSGFYKCSPGPDFINAVRVRILSRIESGSGFYWCSPGPDYINQSLDVSPDAFVVRLRVLSIFQSGSGFYQTSPGLGPGPGLDFTQFKSGFY